MICFDFYLCCLIVDAEFVIVVYCLWLCCLALIMCGLVLVSLATDA